MLLFLLAVAAGAGWLGQNLRLAAGRTLAALEQKRQERDRLARQSPALSEENERAIARDLANSQLVLAALRTELQVKPGHAPGPAPAKPIDLYFGLAAFVEHTRARAARAQVGLKSDERFGFASHTQAGPAAGLIAAVHQQQVAGQMLTEALLEAHPRSVLSVRRERPLTAAQRADRNRPVAANQTSPVVLSPAEDPAGDFFEFDPALSSRVAGLVDSDAFRLEFTGQTPVLRSFLNTLAAGPWPVVVRTVEVEPQAAEGALLPPAGSAHATEATVPLVRSQSSRFRVVVEVVQLIPEPARLAP